MLRALFGCGLVELLFRLFGVSGVVVFWFDLGLVGIRREFVCGWLIADCLGWLIVLVRICIAVYVVSFYCLVLYCDLVACFCCLCLYSLRGFGLVCWVCLYCGCLVVARWFRRLLTCVLV